MSKELLERAKSEIQRLRRDNEILSARNDVVEVFATVLGMRGRGQALTVDIVWEIERYLDSIGVSPMPVTPEPVVPEPPMWREK